MATQRQAFALETARPDTPSWRRTGPMPGPGAATSAPGPRLLAVFAGLAFAALAVCLFVDLGRRPMPVQDEGAIATTARTLAADGVFATRTSEGDETFGAVQSVGPTLLVPLAASFRLFGPGLVQGRAVVAAMTLLTAAAMFALGTRLFGMRAGLLALGCLCASPTVAFLLHGRQILGEVPALGFFAAGVFVWAGQPDGRPIGRSILTGLLLGAAMVTKPQYVAVTFAALGVCSVLAVVYYGNRHLVTLAIIAVMAALCVASWHVWQWHAFGPALYGQNAAKLRALAQDSYGFDWRVTLRTVKLLLGSQSDHLYQFVGPIALIVGLRRCHKAMPGAIVCAFLLLCITIWLTAFLAFMPPVPRMALGAIALLALFVGDLWDSLLTVVSGSNPQASCEPIPRPALGRTMAAWVVPMLLTQMLGYGLWRTISMDLLTPHDEPAQLAAFLDAHVPADRVIETWEREAGILTSHVYHYPDQSWLGPSNAAQLRLAPRRYALGESYFTTHRPDYVVLGWYARFSHIYDETWLAAHGTTIATIGSGEFRYEVIKAWPPESPR